MLQPAGTNLDTPGASRSILTSKPKANVVVEISNWCRKYKRLTSENIDLFGQGKISEQEPAINLGELQWNFYRPHTTSTTIRTIGKKPFLKGNHTCKKLFSVKSVSFSFFSCFMLFLERDPGPSCTVLPLHRWRRICHSRGGCGRYANWMVLVRLWDFRRFLSKMCGAS